MHTLADLAYKYLLGEIDTHGVLKDTRNHLTKSSIFLRETVFIETPIVTFRKTAWKKALKEMEWFLSGDIKCPKDLLDWWNGQLDPDGDYVAGYGDQLRTFGTGWFDQIRFIQEELKAHPNSRRLITTTWHPQDMAVITELNGNPNTPTTCHGTISQYFVLEDKLWIKTYQRSADMLLGVPHNWIQYWAYLMWLAHWAGYKVGGLYWCFGDAHIYQEESHLQAMSEILEAPVGYPEEYNLVYNPTSQQFLASDFSFDKPLPEPKVLTRPKLL